MYLMLKTKSNKQKKHNVTKFYEVFTAPGQLQSKTEF